MFTEINVDNIINVSVYVNSTMEEELDSVTITIDPYTLTKEDVAVGVRAGFHFVFNLIKDKLTTEFL